MRGRERRKNRRKCVSSRRFYQSGQAKVYSNGEMSASNACPVPRLKRSCVQGWLDGPAANGVSAWHDHAGLIDSAGEVLVEGKQTVRFALAERTPQFLLNPVHCMEKCPPVDLHVLATQSPVRAQDKMIPEYGILEFVEIAAAYQTEIGNIILVQSRAKALTLSLPLQGTRVIWLP